MMFNNWDIADLYKALIALAAGVILGMERELKDKAAGLKTITVLTMGCALIAILSQKMGGPGEYTRIASYIVAGIGFLGGGVIFRDSINVTGLTTAAVIWLAAAVGMAIGFGQVYSGFVFLLISLCIIHFPHTVSRFFRGGRISRLLVITINRADMARRTEIAETLKQYLIEYEEKKVKGNADSLIIYIDITLDKARVKELEAVLLKQPGISTFEF